MPAYYNEFDPYAAQWLRNLIAAGHIAAGVVDERSICDVDSADLAGFTQCHFFAGIGVWSRALRLAGWPDDRPVWTGSCPCQPFSSAGKGAGFADERHLWPAFHWLISQCRPPIVFGEQVASKDGLGWLDLVQADLEGSGYATGAADMCAAGVGAPHIRQRLYWVADADCQRPVGQHALLQRQEPGRQQPDCAEVAWGGAVVRLDNNNNTGLEGHGWRHRAEIGHGPGAAGSVAEAGELGGVDNPISIGRGTQRDGYHARDDGQQLDANVGDGGLAYADMPVAQQSAGERSRPGETPGAGPCGELDGRGELVEEQPAASPTNGHWRAADWLHCRDGKWRPVEPGTFPLAHGAPARVGRLRAYGNAIVPQVAQAFIEAVMECRP